MQPVQLSLIPEPAMAPPPTAGELPALGLPAEAVAAATVLLASVIAKAAAPCGMQAAADE
jgi:hypothetical protein